MSRLEEIFDKSISEYNENVSDFHKFKFSDKEKMMFLNMMKEYGRECSQASLEKASENGLVKHSFLGNSETSKAIGDGNQVFTVDKESITNPENIVLL